MGRLIDVDSLILEQQSLEDVGQGIMEFYSKEQINNAETVEAIPKSDYEEQIKINNKLVKDNKQLKAYITMMQVDYNLRLKAEKVAMLTELQAEIEECKEDTENYSDYNAGLRQGIYAIQQKIDKLNEEQRA